jgi:hypothetical protein
MEMRIKTVALFSMIALVVVAGSVWSINQEPGDKVTKAAIMRLKLEPAKKILEGIALGDFQAVRKNTEQIRLLTLDESWMLVQTDDYRQQTKNFERSLNLLNRMCDEKDIEGVTLAYMQVTMRCVECHQRMRDLRK